MTIKTERELNYQELLQLYVDFFLFRYRQFIKSHDKCTCLQLHT